MSIGTLIPQEVTVKELLSQIEIEASAERVWHVLTDFDAYPQTSSARLNCFPTEKAKNGPTPNSLPPSPTPAYASKTR